MTTKQLFPIWTIETANNHIDCGNDINVRDRDGNTILHFSGKNRNLDLLTKCLKSSPDVNLQNMKGDTALSYAAGIRGEIGFYCVYALLEAGANPNIGGCLLPIHQAAQIGDLDILHMLLLGGANADAPDYIGRSAGKIGLINGNSDVTVCIESFKSRLLS